MVLGKPCYYSRKLTKSQEEFLSETIGFEGDCAIDIIFTMKAAELLNVPLNQVEVLK